MNNYIDENDGMGLGSTGGLAMKKISSDYEPVAQKLSTREYGIVSNNFGRSSVNGLNLRRLNSMREGY